MKGYLIFCLVFWTGFQLANCGKKFSTATPKQEKIINDLLKTWILTSVTIREFETDTTRTFYSVAGQSTSESFNIREETTEGKYIIIWLASGDNVFAALKVMSGAVFKAEVFQDAFKKSMKTGVMQKLG